MACWSKTELARLLSFVGLLSSCTAQSLNVHWVSTPVLPGQTALIAVAPRMDNSTTIELRCSSSSPWLKMALTGVTEFGCAIQVPSTCSEFGLQVRANGGPITNMNVADPWFMFGDGGSSSTPGGWVRVIGEGITLTANSQTLPTLLLVPLQASSQKTLTLTAKPSVFGDGVGAKLTRWHAFFDIPATVEAGTTFNVSISNNGDDPSSFVPLCTFVNENVACLNTWTINSPHVWKSEVFTVKAEQPGVGRNATDAVLAALQQCTANGGGVVYFPRGQYFISVPLVVSPGTILRGESRALVSIYFAEANQNNAPPAYVTSTVGGSWGAEDLTFYVTAYAHNIVQFQPGTDFAFLRRCRIRYNSYFCLEPVLGQGSRGRNSAWSHAVGTAVMLAGTNLFVEDNDIFSSGDVVSTLNNGAVGGTYMQIARNRFYNGGTTHWGISWKQCIYEDNMATGTSTTAMGSNYPQYAHTDGEPHVQNVYHHNNSQNLVWGNDREMMTCDGGGGVYYGPATSTGTLVTLATKASSAQNGGALCVLLGDVTGECRRVIGNPSVAPGTPVKDSPIAATTCSSATSAHFNEWSVSSTGSTGGLFTLANTSLAMSVLCGGGGANCGHTSVSEALWVSTNDSWAWSRGTNIFRFEPLTNSTGNIKLVTSGKCVGVVEGSISAMLIDCDVTGTSVEWEMMQLSNGNHQFKLVPKGRLAEANDVCLSVATHAAGNLTVFSIDRPFTNDLTNTSEVTILPFIGHIAFNGNNYTDGGEVQFYAQAFSVVAAENTFERTGGLSAWARGYSGKDANLCNSFIDNHVVEGNHVWNYNTLPNPATDPNSFPYFPGGSKTMEPWFFGSFTNEQGLPIDPGTPSGFTGAFNRFIVFRGNQIDNNGGIVVRGTSANVLVEGNTIEQSDVAVHVNESTTQGGVVVVNNTAPPSVEPNYNPYAKNNQSKPI
eukprot:m.141853 g.141853  ORF g.141853 m.141853 type:complete len:943 (+) comp30217_c0_seq1:33-2861(+)